ncbi:MAG: DUF1266 domain-containing protein [Planctomycetota bacterium]
MLLALIANPSNKCQEAKSVPVFDEGQVVVTGAKAWALGCAAVLTERNHDQHDLLGGEPRTKRNIEGKKKLLDEWWGITSRGDLFDSLLSLHTWGHRERFKQGGNYIENLSEEQYKDFLEQNKDDEQKLQEIKVVRKYYKELGEKGLWGWDYSRYICLCRWGYMVGYISEDEAWEKIIPAAKILQEKFDSWEDLGRNFLIGRQFWSYKHTKESGYLFEDAYLRLLDIPSSPWNKYSWNMDLTYTKTAQEPNAVSKKDPNNTIE